MNAGVIFEAHAACGSSDPDNLIEQTKLAAFLTAAGNGSYYLCGGWGSATVDWFPIYDLPLGDPLSEAVLGADGVYRRSFAKGTTVTFSTKTNNGTIKWASRKTDDGAAPPAYPIDAVWMYGRDSAAAWDATLSQFAAQGGKTVWVFGSSVVRSSASTVRNASSFEGCVVKGQHCVDVSMSAVAQTGGTVGEILTLEVGTQIAPAALTPCLSSGIGELHLPPGMKGGSKNEYWVAVLPRWEQSATEKQSCAMKRGGVVDIVLVNMPNAQYTPTPNDQHLLLLEATARHDMEAIVTMPGIPHLPAPKTWAIDTVAIQAFIGVVERTTTDLCTRFGSHKSLKGVYQSYESPISGLWLPVSYKTYEQVAGQVHNVSVRHCKRRLQFALSPYWAVKKGGDNTTFEESIAGIAALAAQPNIDIIAPQEGRGTGKSALFWPHEADLQVASVDPNLARYPHVDGAKSFREQWWASTAQLFQAGRAEVDKANVRRASPVEYWMNLEAFESTRFDSCDGHYLDRTNKTRVDRSLMMGAGHVDKVVSFMWDPFFKCTPGGYENRSLNDDIVADLHRPIMGAATLKPPRSAEIAGWSLCGAGAAVTVSWAPADRGRRGADRMNATVDLTNCEMSQAKQGSTMTSRASLALPFDLGSIQPGSYIGLRPSAAGLSSSGEFAATIAALDSANRPSTATTNLNDTPSTFPRKPVKTDDDGQRWRLLSVDTATNSSSNLNAAVLRSDDGAAPLAPSPFLPPLLRLNSGGMVTSSVEWPNRREEISALVQEYLLGTVPPQRPPLLTAVTLNTTEMPRGALSTFVRLTFDVSSGGSVHTTNISFDVELLRPAPLASNAEPQHPLFITMYTHRAWALLGLARGYAAAIFPGCDGQDIAPAFQAAYPNSSMALIMARGFVASLTLDHALELPWVKTEQVCMTGHSRNGKLSLVTAAFDERITAVVGSSPGAPIATPFRFSSAYYYGQDAVTSPPPSVWFSWWCPKNREFIGRENEMPIDGHGVVGMIAPRAAAIATAWQDRESDLTFGNEQNLKESSKVYSMLGAERNLSLLYRPGDHHGFIDPGSYFDFFDKSFGRRQELAGNSVSGVSPASDAFITPAGFDWKAWQRLTNSSRDDAPLSSEPLANRVGWLLDTSVEPRPLPAQGSFSVPDAYNEEANPGQYSTLLMDHDRSKSDARYVNLTAVPFSFGEYRTATAYYDKRVVEECAGADGVPVVLWLHPYSYNRGFDTGGNNTDTFLVLAKKGFLVLAFDLAGMGMRYNEGGQRFYRAHGGRASLLGQHVTDTLALLQAVRCFSAEGRADSRCSHGNRGFTWPTPALDALPIVNPAQIFAGGFSLGGNIALHAAALDRRIAAVFAIAAFTPMRTDTAGRPTGGLKRLSHLHALVPKLGLYVGSERVVPYDYDELLGAIAPRPALLVTPTRDRDATLSDVNTTIERSRHSWVAKKAGDKLVHLVPDDYSRLSMKMTDNVVEWAIQTLGTL